MWSARFACAISVCLFVATMCLAQHEAKPISNDDVTAMVALGLSDDVIIEKIYAASTPEFDTSVAGLQALKAARVSDAVIRAMINPHAPPTVPSDAGAAKFDPNDPNTPHDPVSTCTRKHEMACACSCSNPPYIRAEVAGALSSLR